MGLLLAAAVCAPEGCAAGRGRRGRGYRGHQGCGSGDTGDVGMGTPGTWVWGHRGRGSGDTGDVGMGTPGTWVPGTLGMWVWGHRGCGYGDTGDVGLGTAGTWVWGHQGHGSGDTGDVGTGTLGMWVWGHQGCGSGDTRDVGTGTPGTWVWGPCGCGYEDAGFPHDLSLATGGAGLSHLPPCSTPHLVTQRDLVCSSGAVVSAKQFEVCAVGKGFWAALQPRWGRGGIISNDPRAGASPLLLGGQAGRAGAGQPGEEKAAGRPESSCQCLEGLRESWRGAVTQAWSDSTRGHGFKLKEGRLRLEIRKKFFPLRVVRPWPRLPSSPGSVQGQAGRGSEHPGLVEGVPAHGRGVKRAL